MEKNLNFKLTKPCADCPFRKDCLKGWLPNRAKEIAEYGLNDMTFPCHKTSELNEYSQCVGSLLLTSKTPGGINQNFAFRLAMMAGQLKEESLKGHDLIFDTVEEMVEHHK